MSKLPIFEHILSVGNLKPKFKWFFSQKLEPIFFLLNCLPVHVVRHEEQHAELLQRDQLHVALVARPHLEPLQQRLGVHLGHGWWSVVPGG